MDTDDIEAVLGHELSSALARKGYAQLTPVQHAVLDPALHERDLRITSQTGSGKTLAIGFVLRTCVQQAPLDATKVARPCALIVAPTRELAQQTAAELQWLYAGCQAHVVAITGGASHRDEHRALARGARIVVVGTPGRLLDHLDRGSIELSQVAALVLDEADRLLDMGFREELDRIFEHAPKQRRTHLVSATFPRAVRTLADRVQVDAAHVEGTRLGEANQDIDHVLHVIDPRQKFDAIVNLLLANPDAQTLVFARTRADVTRLTDELISAGFAASAISGELDQAARNRALSAFKQGHKSVLVATDVAARGIDLQGVLRVIHAELPTSADAYTHRAGRTGRAGRKGTSSLLVTPAEVVPATRLLRAASIPHRFEAIPSAAAIERASDDRLFELLTGEDAPVPAADQQRALALAARLLAAGNDAALVARLLLRIKGAAGPRPRELRSVPVSAPRAATGRKAVRSPQPQRHATQHAFAAAEAAVPFRVSWGARQGADARKLLAIVCRRGRIRGTEVGAIRIDADHSIVEVQAGAAEAFAVHAARPDPRAPRLRIGLWRPHNQGHEPGDRSSITPDKHRGSATPNRNGGHKPPRRRA